MSDIEKSFTFLHDNIPQWFKDITSMEESIALMQDEIARVPVSRSPFAKKKTGSVESIRDLDAILEEPNSSSTAQPAPFASRKRKTPSVISGHASGPAKFRTKTMVVVQYDGQMQKQFEVLVRSIGTGRNMLRKGKMAARMEALAELAGSDDDSEGDDDTVMSKIGYRHRAGLSSMRSRGPMRAGMSPMSSSNSSQEIFDSCDKALELAQGLCERGAHSSLRDGDCRKELDGVRRHFQEVLDKATKEVEKYKARKERESAIQVAAEADTKADVPTRTPTAVEPKPVLPVISPRPVIAAIPTTSKAVDIEIDDDEGDDMDLVMPPIRLTSRA